MLSIIRPSGRPQAFLFSLVGLMLAIAGFAPDNVRAADKPNEAKTEKQMKPYREVLSGTEIVFGLTPIPGGEFLMGSSLDEEGRNDDEGPQRTIKIKPFWMGTHEVTWDEYDIWSFSLDIQRRKIQGLKPTTGDKVADAVTRPTKPYTDMTFDMGHDGFPAICMTQLAAKMYCQWLSAKTGHFYRLPTEAEWEYACRAGTTTAYSFGDDVSKLGDYAWYVDNNDFVYAKVGKKKPNPWGLYDIHGNVAEWCLDQYLPDAYAKRDAKGVTANPLSVPSLTVRYKRVVRGGSWDDDAETLRSAARVPSTPNWKVQDPQLPQSIWFLTDALHVGFRVVRPLVEPTEKEKMKLRLIPETLDLLKDPNEVQEKLDEAGKK